MLTAWMVGVGRPDLGVAASASEARAPDHEHENQDEVQRQHRPHDPCAAAALLELDHLRRQPSGGSRAPRRGAHRDELFLEIDHAPRVRERRSVRQPDPQHVQHDGGDDPRVAEAPGLVAQHDEQHPEDEDGVDEEHADPRHEEVGLGDGEAFLALAAPGLLAVDPVEQHGTEADDRRQDVQHEDELVDAAVDAHDASLPAVATAPRSLGPRRLRCGTTRPVRLVVARCSVEYEGRLGARLPPAQRLILLKADGSIAVHADSKAYKPLNWMSPPCTIREEPGAIIASNPGGERLTIALHEVSLDHDITLGDDPGLDKDGVEAELQELIAARVRALRDDLRIVRREYPTDIGTVDLLCRDGEDRAVVIEVKRIGEIAGVEQLLRYQERLDLDATLAPTNGLFVATRLKPQARVFAESRGVECIEVDLERLRGDAPPDLRLF